MQSGDTLNVTRFIGPLIGGVLLGRHWASNETWLAFGASALVSVVPILLLRRQIRPLREASEPVGRRA
jgi:hypothetical protein